MSAKTSLARAKQKAVFAPYGGGPGFSPYIPVSAEAAQRLVEIVLNAKRSKKADPNPTPVDHAAMSAAWVAQDAVSRLNKRKIFSLAVTHFRAVVRGKETRALLKKRGSLRPAIENLMNLLPKHDGMPPWPQMRAQFSGGNPFSDGPDREGDKARKRSGKGVCTRQ